MPTFTIVEQNLTGQPIGELTFELLTESITVRELIRAQVCQRVQDHGRGTRTMTERAQSLRGPHHPAARIRRSVRPAGWKYRLQGNWDGASTPTLELSALGLEVEVWVEQLSDRDPDEMTSDFNPVTARNK
jgi:hypothetical protein